jgi:hypothetical protein
MSYQQAIRVSTVLALLEAVRMLATRTACQENTTAMLTYSKLAFTVTALVAQEGVFWMRL